MEQTEAACMHNNSSRLDNILGSDIRTYLGGIPDSELMLMLSLDERWTVVSTSIQDYPPGSQSKGRIVFTVDVEHGMKWPCPKCGNMCGVHEYEVRTYQTVPILNHQTFIKAQIPKLKCKICGSVRQAEIRWARPNVSYTVDFEKAILSEVEDRPIISTAFHLDTSDYIVYDVVRYRVNEALKKLDLSNVTTLYVDETSFKKGHRYVAVICDEFKRIIFVCEGKDSSTIDRFYDWLVEHKGNPDNIAAVSCDMGLAYPAGIERNFPNAKIVFDRFHVVKLVSEAFDKFYRRIMAKGELKAARNFLRYKHLRDFSDKQKMMFELIQSEHSEVAEAYRMKEVIYSMYDYGDKGIATAYFDTWLNSVKKNGPPELRIAAETLESRREGIFLWYDRSINNGLSEGINSLIQTTKRIARGYRNVDNFISMCYLRNGHLDIEF